MGCGDPWSTNRPGREARKFLEAASARVASLFGGAASHFYGGHPIAAGLAVISMGRRAREQGRNHIIASPLERSPVHSGLRQLREEGSTVTFLTCDGNGRISPSALREAMTDETGLVAVTWASTVSGVVQPVAALAEIAAKGGAAFFSDATEAAGRIEIDLSRTRIDAIAISSHKVGGVPGVGAIVSATHDPLLMNPAPELSGPGNLPGIAALQAALETVCSGVVPRGRMMDRLRDELLEGLERRGTCFHQLVEAGTERLPGSGFIRLEGAPARFHALLEQEEVIVPSHDSTDRLAYLRATGSDAVDRLDEFLGFCMGSTTTVLEVERLVAVVCSLVGERSRR